MRLPCLLQNLSKTELQISHRDLLAAVGYGATPPQYIQGLQGTQKWVFQHEPARELSCKLDCNVTEIHSW